MHTTTNQIYRIVLLLLVIQHLSWSQQVHTYTNQSPVNRDSLMRLNINRTRSMTRVELGFGVTHLGLKGDQWTTDFFSKAKDTISFSEAKNSFSFSIGCAFPIKKFTNTSALGLNISLLNALGSHTSISIPTFLTYKWGGDATTYAYHKKVGLCLGIGPQLGYYTLTSLNTEILRTGYLRPTYMAEISVTPRFGMLKFRFLGNIGVFKKTVGDGSSSLGFSGYYQVRPHLTGLIIYTPFWAVQKHITRAFDKLPK